MCVVVASCPRQRCHAASRHARYSGDSNENLYFEDLLRRKGNRRAKARRGGGATVAGSTGRDQGECAEQP
eukprot:scaffold2947_cov67-Phaeocystis_antarctica.AAC.3